MSAHAYSSDFYDYIGGGSRASAQVVSSLLMSQISIASVLDVGGGNGVWLREWMRRGVADALTIDGSYVREEQLVVPQTCHQAHDLSGPVELGRRFDLVQSLEVAEHIEPERAEIFVDTLTRHGDIVLFSAAVPNQGGEHHLNERPYAYWRALFAERGFEAHDWLRPQLVEQKAVKPWYRFNSFLYANAAGAARLSADVAASRVPADEPLRDVGDWRWQLRRATVSIIPPALVKPLAMLKASAEVRVKASRTSGE